MLSFRACQTLVIMTALAATPAVATRTHRAPTSGHHKASSKKAKHAHVAMGQRTIDPDRAREIQTALIRENYMSGAPSGQWDAESQAAMVKYQSDHGWQTKLTPDSRALIKLGLGPNHSAETAAAKTDATPDPAAAPTFAANTLADTHSIQN